MSEQLLTPEQVAERLQLSHRTIYTWLRAGKLPGVKLGRVWRVRPADLDTLVSPSTKPANWRERFDDILARLRAHVPPGLTEEEIEADVLTAIDEARAEIHAARRR